MGMTITEKILARKCGRALVSPGDLVTVGADTVVFVDLCSRPRAGARSTGSIIPNASLPCSTIERLHDIGYD